MSILNKSISKLQFSFKTCFTFSGLIFCSTIFKSPFQRFIFEEAFFLKLSIQSIISPLGWYLSYKNLVLASIYSPTPISTKFGFKILSLVNKKSIIPSSPFWEFIFNSNSLILFPLSYKFLLQSKLFSPILKFNCEKLLPISVFVDVFLLILKILKNYSSDCFVVFFVLFLQFVISQCPPKW